MPIPESKITILTSTDGNSVKGSSFSFVGSGGMSIVSNPSTDAITFSGGGWGGLSWQSISASQALVPNNGYIVTGGAVSLSLPASSSVGDEIIVILDSGTSWRVTQAGAQCIRYGIYQTTVGTGSLQSSDQGDSIRMVCVSGTPVGERWVVYSSVGNINIS